MPSFLNLKSSHPEESCKKCVFKLNTLKNSLRNAQDDVFNKI